jgi:hypothetical protein
MLRLFLDQPDRKVLKEPPVHKDLREQLDLKVLRELKVILEQQDPQVLRVLKDHRELKVI